MTICLTLKASEKIAEILRKESKFALRISVIGGKCAGFAYQYELVEDAKENDYLLEQEGARLLIDPISLPLLDGAELDFIEDLMGENFKINNPNARSSCGCGLSFSI